MKQRFFAILLLLLLVGACGRDAPGPPAAPAAREARKLRIGLSPEQNVFEQLARYEPLAGYVGRRTGVKVEFVVLTRYADIVADVGSADLDGAFFGSFGYVLARSRYRLEPVARPVHPDGRSTYFGVILVRRDGGVRSAEDLRGKRFAFVDRATTAGYLLPLDYFLASGIEDYRTFLREYYFAGTHENAVRDVLEKRADAAAAKSTVVQRLGATDPRIPHELVPVARSPDVPENALCLRATIDADLRRRIRETLVDMASDPEGREVLAHFGALRFIPTADSDYASVYAYLRHLGIDPATFDYTVDQ